MNKIRRLTIYTSKISKNKKILVYSDLHMGYKTNHNIKELTQIPELKPDHFDYILIPGDIVHSGKCLEEEKIRNQVIQNIQRLVGETKTYVSIGNHDQYERHGFEKWESYSATTIINTLNSLPNIHVIKNGEVMKEENIEFGAMSNTAAYYLENHESLESYYQEYQQTSNKQSFSPKAFSIFLTHDPKSIYRISKSNNRCLEPNTDLVVTGHMHNGFTPNSLQPVLKGQGIVSPDYTFFPEIAYGVKEVGQTLFLVNGAVSSFVENTLINRCFGTNCTIIELVSMPTSKDTTNPPKLVYKYK